MVNSEESSGVVFFFLFFAGYILAQEVQCLVPATARHLLTSNHLQKREKNGFQVFRSIYRGTGDIKGFIFHSVPLSAKYQQEYSYSHSFYMILKGVVED